MTTLADRYDHFLLDLDGTLYHGPQPIPSALDALRGLSHHLTYVTNNASRTPQNVADNLALMGYTATVDQVATSAQAAATLLAQELAPGSAVLVVGAPSLEEELRQRGLHPVYQVSDNPLAVVQGHSPTTDWPRLAEAALAIRSGALWVACNLDPTLPTERGLLPGNGSMIAALITATDQQPVVAGKPAAPLMLAAQQRVPAHAPLVIGDRLDTDIAGAHSVGLPSLLVLTGVSTADEAYNAQGELQPTYVADDLNALHTPLEPLQYETWRRTYNPIR